MLSNYLAFCLLICFVSSIAGRHAIIGGEVARADQFPYQVSLQSNDQHFCGGGIIGDLHILTAAHCLLDSNGRMAYKSITVFAGTNNLKDNGGLVIAIKVKKVYVSSQFNRKLLNTGDVAVLKLKHALKLSKFKHIEKLDLPATSNEQDVCGKETGKIAGFGWHWVKLENDREIGGNDDHQLRYADVELLSVCEKRYYLHTYADRQICAKVKTRWLSRKDAGVCYGDSGSPLVCNGNTAVAILSISPATCSEKENGALYTRVSYYRDFIDNAMHDNNVDMRIFELNH